MCQMSWGRYQKHTLINVLEAIIRQYDEWAVCLSAITTVELTESRKNKKNTQKAFRAFSLLPIKSESLSRKMSLLLYDETHLETFNLASCLGTSFSDREPHKFSY